MEQIELSKARVEALNAEIQTYLAKLGDQQQQPPPPPPTNWSPRLALRVRPGLAEACHI
ncbi:MAG TPA: hypothetical protein VEB21_09115 [Terriglobales bacterium]|nr:hypothetical protein [Terriglobales bacterium]